ncbi:MAG: hypothetical protein VST65_04200 [Nitrospirota bacterium]|nr:hypothetical protein [Nitrospirota bacterium]
MLLFAEVGPVGGVRQVPRRTVSTPSRRLYWMEWSRLTDSPGLQKIQSPEGKECGLFERPAPKEAGHAPPTAIVAGRYVFSVTAQDPDGK